MIRKRQSLIQSKIGKQAETAAPLQKKVAVEKRDIDRKNLSQADDASKIFEELDINRRKNLPHADDTSKIVEELGGDTSGLGTAGWHSTKDTLEGLANGLIDERPGNRLGNGTDGLQGGLVEAENALGKGSSEFIGGLNNGYNEYWADVVAGIKGAGGIIAYGSRRYDNEDGSVDIIEERDDGSVWVWFYDKNYNLTGGGELIPPQQPAPGSGGGTQASDGSDGEVNEGNVITSGRKGPRPIEVDDPNKKESGIKTVQTDTGVVMVVDYEQLRDATKTGPEEGMSIGTNHLTGEAVNVTPGEVDPKARFGQFLKQEVSNPITNPTR